MFERSQIPAVTPAEVDADKAAQGQVHLFDVREPDEYRAVRAQAGGFLDLVYNPELAAEVTLQPIRRFGFDAAILFSDILVIPHALGRNVRFVAGEGPQLDPIGGEKEIEALNVADTAKKLGPVFETLKFVKKDLPAAVTLIGFCGAPWTVATYMIAGRGGDDQEAAKIMAYTQPQLFTKLIDKLVESSVIYLVAQLKAGADCVQIFDSWSGALDSFAFEKFVIAPTKKIVDGVRAQIPNAKIIGFPRGAGSLARFYASMTGVTALGIDWQQDLAICAEEIKLPLQGNLDPLRLFGSHETLRDMISCMKRTMRGKPYIFNLGHGITPQTPIESVEHMLHAVRETGP